MASSPWPVTPAAPVPDDDPRSWRTVRVYVSSSFDDMHAERDLLVKRVFPRLRCFCEKRRLWLFEVDLRWGVTEEEATANPNTVGVCLRGVERSEVFLGLLGQRYGWQPGAANLEDATREFPALARVAQDRLSLTELEIRQALGILPGTPAGAGQPKAHLFYRRDASYLQRMPADAPALLYRIYRDDDSPGNEQRDKLERLEQALEPLIVDFQAKWIPGAAIPELRLPLRAPSADEPSVARWQRTWRDHAGLAVEGAQIPAESELGTQAEHFNISLARGRLAEFRVGAQAFSDRLVADLEVTVERAFPARVPSHSDDPLSLDLEQQEAFLSKAIEGFVERPHDRARLDTYRAAPDRRVLFMAAPSGSGKTTLLARWIEANRAADARAPVLFRFIGASDRSTCIEDLLRSLLGEVQRRILPSLTIPQTDRELRLVWLDRLAAALAGRRAIVVVDGLDQLDTGLDDLTWLPTRLPEGLGLIASFRLEGEKADNLRLRIEHGTLATLVACEPFADADKERLVNRFLEPTLKRLDAGHVRSVLSFQGAKLPSAPLFLKVVLSEISLFGSFQNLGEELRRLDGTPESAFGRLMARLQDNQATSPLPLRVVLTTILPALALARNGLDAQELGEILRTDLGRPASMQDALDAVHVAIYQLRDSLAMRAGRFVIFTSSLKSAIIVGFASGEGGVPPVHHWHERLAQLFEGQRRGTAARSRWLSELPYHLAASGQYEALVLLLADLTFIEAKYAAGLGPELLADYDRIVDTQVLSQSARIVWQDFRRFVRTHHAVLRREPGLTHQQALNEPDASAPHRAADGLTLSIPTSLFRWDNKPQTPLSTITLRVPPPEGANVLCRHVAETPGLMVEGTDGGRLLLTDLHTGKVAVDQDMGEAISACELSSDGSRVASVGGQRNLRIHGVNPWTLISEQTLLSPADHIRATPSFDRLAVAVGGEVDLWVPGGSLIRLIPTGGRIHDCAFSPDGKALATVGSDGGVCLWNVEDGSLRWHLQQDATDVRSCRFSRSGRFLVTGAQRHFSVWDVQEERLVRHVDGHRGGITALASIEESADSLTLLTAGDDGWLESHRVSTVNHESPAGGGGSSWRLDMESGPLRGLWVLPRTHEAVVDAAAGPASAADLAVAEQRAGLDRESRDEISAIVLGPQQMVAGDVDGWVHIFDAEGTRRHRAHRDLVTSVMQLANGTVVSTGSDGSISVLAAGSNTPEPHHVHTRGLQCSASDAECQHIAVGDDGGEVSILAVEEASLRSVNRFGTRDGHAVQALTWLPMGGLFALATTACIEMRALPDRRAIGSFPHEVGIPVCLLTIPGTTTLTTVGRDGRVSWWDSSDPQPDIQRQRLPLAQVTAAAFLSRHELLTAHTTGEIALWQWPELLRVGLMPTGERLQAITIDVRTRRVAAAGSGGRPLVFDLRGR